METQLRGQRALITGASKGIGRAIASVLAQEGCDIEIAARDQRALSELAQSLESRCGIQVHAHALDLSKSTEQTRLLEAVGSVDILVNNAGAVRSGEIDEISEEAWRESWDLKVFGQINLTRACYARMKARKCGVIINIIGNAGERMQSRYIAGATGNAGLMAFTRALGSRSPDYGVRVVGINPGLTATDRAMTMFRRRSETLFGTTDRWPEVLKQMNLPFGRMGEPDEIANLVAFLASPLAGYISGTIVTIDGGQTYREG